MDHPIGHELSLVGIIISFTSGFIAFISAESLQLWVSLFASLVAVMSGLFACRYYWLAIKEKKRNLKKN